MQSLNPNNKGSRTKIPEPLPLFLYQNLSNYPNLFLQMKKIG
jgi:hypothetical protein